MNGLRAVPAMWKLAALILLLLTSTAATADVVILRENDIPIQGRILEESETAVTFQIRGLGDGAKMVIEKSRIRRFWREENSYFEYLQSEKERLGTLGKFMVETPPARAKDAPAPPAPAPFVPGARSADEIRKEFLMKAWGRLSGAVPQAMFLRVLLGLASIVFLMIVLQTGARLASLRRLKLPQAALLSLLTHLLLVVALAAPRTIIHPSYLPVLVTAEVVLWLFLARMLTGALLARAFLLFSICLGSIALLGGSVFSVLTVL